MKLHLPKIFLAALFCTAGLSYGAVTVQETYTVERSLSNLGTSGILGSYSYTKDANSDMVTVTGYTLTSNDNLLDNVTFRMNTTELHKLSAGSNIKLVYAHFASNDWGINVKNRNGSVVFTGNANQSNLDFGTGMSPIPAASEEGSVVTARFHKTATGTTLVSGFSSSTTETDCLYYNESLRYTHAGDLNGVVFNSKYVSGIIESVSKVSGTIAGGADSLDKINAYTTQWVELNGVSGWLQTTGSAWNVGITANLILTNAADGSALYLNNGSSDKTHTFSGRVSGTGDIAFGIGKNGSKNITVNNVTIDFTNDTSAWTGKFKVDAVSGNTGKTFIAKYSYDGTISNGFEAAAGQTIEVAVAGTGTRDFSALTFGGEGSYGLIGDGTVTVKLPNEMSLSTLKLKSGILTLDGADISAVTTTDFNGGSHTGALKLINGSTINIGSDTSNSQGLWMNSATAKISADASSTVSMDDVSFSGQKGNSELGTLTYTGENAQVSSFLSDKLVYTDAVVTYTGTQGANDAAAGMGAKLVGSDIVLRSGKLNLTNGGSTINAVDVKADAVLTAATDLAVGGSSTVNGTLQASDGYTLTLKGTVDLADGHGMVKTNGGKVTLAGGSITGSNVTISTAQAAAPAEQSIVPLDLRGDEGEGSAPTGATLSNVTISNSGITAADASKTASISDAEISLSGTDASHTASLTGVDLNDSKVTLGDYATLSGAALDNTTVSVTGTGAKLDGVNLTDSTVEVATGAALELADVVMTGSSVNLADDTATVSVTGDSTIVLTRDMADWVTVANDTATLTLTNVSTVSGNLTLNIEDGFMKALETKYYDQTIPTLTVDLGASLASVAGVAVNVAFPAASTPVWSAEGSAVSITFTPAIPEPATAALSLLALAGLASRRRRK